MKNLKNLGKALNKAEQKQIFGGLTNLEFNDGCYAQDGLMPRGCPCSSSSECSSITVQEYTDFDVNQVGLGGSSYTIAGVCRMGICGF